MPPKAVHCYMAGFTFIAAQMDLTTPVMTGGAVYIADEKERVNMDQLFSVIRKHHVTNMFLPPKLFSVLRELYGRLPLRYAEQAGDKAASKYADDGNVYESYGASETFTVLHHQVGGGDERLLGKPVPGVRVFLTDEEGRRMEKRICAAFAAALKLEEDTLGALACSLLWVGGEYTDDGAGLFVRVEDGDLDDEVKYYMVSPAGNRKAGEEYVGCYGFTWTFTHDSYRY